ELGDWNPDKCSEAFLNPKHPEWYLPVSVPAGKEIKFKFIKKDASGKVIWEEGIADRSVVSSDDSAGVIDTPIYNWGQ
ncbi:carbohydrate-binding module family 20 domain-containing protein, partial [Staphylococcus aureus]